MFGLESKLEIFVSNRCVFVRRSVVERMISACVFLTVKHRGGGDIVWGCFAGDTVCELFRIHGTLNKHGYHSILQRYTIPSGLGLVGLSFFKFKFSPLFNQVGQLRTNSHLQLRPGQDNTKQCNTNNNTELHIE